MDQSGWQKKAQLLINGQLVPSIYTPSGDDPGS
jgi:hypothetical protein